MEDYWNREMASLFHMLQESGQKADCPLLERLASLLETSELSRDLMQKLSELSDTEKSALTVMLLTAFGSNWQSCKEPQQNNDSGSAQREHNTHMHRNLSQNPSTGLGQNSDFCCTRH